METGMCFGKISTKKYIAIEAMTYAGEDLFEVLWRASSWGRTFLIKNYSIIKLIFDREGVTETPLKLERSTMLPVFEKVQSMLADRLYLSGITTIRFNIEA
jgi:hypothetical protein